MAASTPVKKVKNAILREDGQILISNVRLSHPHLDKPYKGKGDAGVAKFSVTGMLDKKKHAEAIKLIQDQIAAVLKENKIKALPADKKCLKDGDESGKTEYEGHYTISAREERRPSLRDEDGETVEQEDAKAKFYGGCYGSILVRLWFQNNDYGKRVNAGLSAVKFKKDGEPFGEGRMTDDDVDEAFSAEDDDDDADETPRRSSGSKRPASRHEDEDDEDDL